MGILSTPKMNAYNYTPTNELFQNALNFSNQMFPYSLKAREKGAQYLTETPFEKQFTLPQTNIPKVDYSQFQPTNFEQALTAQNFQNIWPETEKTIKHGLSLSGMEYSPLLAETLGRERSKLGVDIGTYLTNLSQQRGTTEQARLTNQANMDYQKALNELQLSETGREFDISQAMRTSPYEFIEPLVSAQQTTEAGQAAQELQNYLNKVATQQGTVDALGNIVGTGVNLLATNAMLDKIIKAGKGGTTPPKTGGGGGGGAGTAAGAGAGIGALSGISGNVGALTPSLAGAGAGASTIFPGVTSLSGALATPAIPAGVGASFGASAGATVESATGGALATSQVAPIVEAELAAGGTTTTAASTVSKALSVALPVAFVAVVGYMMWKAQQAKQAKKIGGGAEENLKKALAGEYPTAIGENAIADTWQRANALGMDGVQVALNLERMAEGLPPSIVSGFVNEVQSDFANSAQTPDDIAGKHFAEYLRTSKPKSATLSEWANQKFQELKTPLGVVIKTREYLGL